MMRVWTVSFILFFILTELYQWLEGMVPPFPVFIGAGALLAIASNANKWPLAQPSKPSASATAIAPKPQPTPQMPPKLENTQGLSPSDTPELPQLEKRSDNPFFKESSISFTIRSPQSNTK